MYNSLRNSDWCPYFLMSICLCLTYDFLTIFGVTGSDLSGVIKVSSVSVLRPIIGLVNHPQKSENCVSLELGNNS